MQFVYTKVFLGALRKMKRTGGRKGKAADQVNALLGRITTGDDNPLQGLRPTKHGETRIKKCVKYDLTDFCRLVTIHDGDYVALVYVGDHDDADHWLEANAGMTLGVDQENRLDLVSVSNLASNTKVRVSSDQWSGKLLDRLPSNARRDLLGDLKGRDIEPLHDIEAGSTAESIEQQIKHIEDLDVRTLIFDVLSKLNGGDVEGAEKRIQLHFGDIRTLASLTSEEVLEVKDGKDVRRLTIGSAEYQTWIKNFLESSHSFDWFLFMHPEQEKFVTKDFSGAAKLAGVSGSGKTSIAIRRAIRLAQQYPTEEISILTLNRSLAELISEIADYACLDKEVRSRIHVLSFFVLCQKLLAKFEPDRHKHYSDVTWRLEEHKDEVYREYYRCLNNNLDAEIMLPTHRHLIQQNVDAERYIAEEFDWIRSALPYDQRESYLTIERKGRGYPLDRSHRANILTGLKAWETKMSEVGVIDYMGLTTALTKHASHITPLFRSIIVDEAQDFGTTELSIIRKLVRPAENDLFLCGDAAQHILPKHQVFEHAGIDTGGRSFRITRNYRNSREILETAYKIFVENLSDRHFDNTELEISDPTYANRSSAKPLVLEAKSLETEIAAAKSLIEENAELASSRGQTHSGCVVFAGYSNFEVERFGAEIGVPVLDGARKVVDEPLFFSDLEQTKGYEFDTVVIVNCTDIALPPVGMPEEDSYRFASQFYVALTRAKHNLILSFSGTPSRWITNEKVELQIDQWRDVIDVDSVEPLGVPGFLPEFTDTEIDDMRSLNGRQFLYTPYARGLEVDLQRKIEELVPGQSRLRNNRRVLWKNLGQLLDDLDLGISRGGAANVFGPKADAIVSERLSEASLGLRPTMRRREKFSSQGVADAESAFFERGQTEPSGEYSSRANDTNLSIEQLRLNPKTFALLHQIKIRTIPDILATAPHLLQKYFTSSEISALRAQAASVIHLSSRQFDETDSGGQSLRKSVRTLGLSPRGLKALESVGVRNLQDLENLTEQTLRKSASCSRQEILEIKRIAKKHGISIE